MTPDFEARARAWWLALSPAAALALNRSHGLGGIERVTSYFARHVDRPGPGVDIDAVHYRLGAVNKSSSSGLDTQSSPGPRARATSLDA